MSPCHTAPASSTVTFLFQTCQWIPQFRNVSTVLTGYLISAVFVILPRKSTANLMTVLLCSVLNVFLVVLLDRSMVNFYAQFRWKNWTALHVSHVVCLCPPFFNFCHITLMQYGKNKQFLLVINTCFYFQFCTLAVLIVLLRSNTVLTIVTCRTRIRKRDIQFGKIWSNLHKNHTARNAVRLLHRDQNGGTTAYKQFDKNVK